MPENILIVLVLENPRKMTRTKFYLWLQVPQSCQRYGKKGHYKDKCPKPAKTATETKKEASPTKGGSANAAVQSNSESKGAFTMESNIETDPSTSNDMHELESVTSTSCSSSSDFFNDADFEEGDWFSEMDG